MGGWVAAGEADRRLYLAWDQPDDHSQVGAALRSHFPDEDLLRDVDVSASVGWADLVGQFVVLRYLTPDRSRLGIEIERDRPVVEVVADDAFIEIRRCG